VLSSAQTINVRLELISNVSNDGNLWNGLTASGLAMFYGGDKWCDYLCKPFILVIYRGVIEVPRHSMIFNRVKRLRAKRI
jgi:hypothetical protein